MTLHTAYNKSGMGGNITNWWLHRTIISAGGVVAASGSGTGGSYSAVGDVFDPAGGNPYNYTNGAASGKLGSGAGTEPWVGAPLAWILIDYMDGSQLLIQRDSGVGDSSDDEWTYALFPDGDADLTPCNANTAPSAAVGGNLRVLKGTINGVGDSLYAHGTKANLTHVAVDDAPSAAGAYGICLVEFITPNTLNGVFIRDDLQQVKSTLITAQPQSWLIRRGSTSLASTVLFSKSVTDLYSNAWVDFGGGTELWDAAPYYRPEDNLGVALYPSNAGSSAIGQSDHPIDVGNATHGGFFGLSRWFKWQAVTRNYPDTNVALTDWYINDVAVSMGDGVTVPGVI